MVYSVVQLFSLLLDIRSDCGLKDVHLGCYWDWIDGFNSWVVISGEHTWLFSEPDTCLEVSIACSDCQIDRSHVSSSVLGESVSPSSFSRSAKQLLLSQLLLKKIGINGYWYKGMVI